MSQLKEKPATYRRSNKGKMKLCKNTWLAFMRKPSKFQTWMSIAVKAMQKGTTSIEFFESLNRKSPTMLVDLMQQAKKYIKQVDAMMTSRFARKSHEKDPTRGPKEGIHTLVFNASPSKGSPYTWKVWLTLLHWNCLGFCCYPHCFWRL